MTQPVYYVYGQGGNVYYENNTVYIDGEAQCTATEYYQQAETLATSIPEYSEPQATELEWLPLGVWAITKEGVSEADRLLQLSVNKDGVIAGTYYNETTETTIPVEGKVDNATQRAAWHLMDEKNNKVVMETGVYNLTEDVTNALLHYGPDKTSEVVLVRIDQPEDEEASSGGSPEANSATQ